MRRPLIVLLPLLLVVGCATAPSVSPSAPLPPGQPAATDAGPVATTPPAAVPEPPRGPDFADMAIPPSSEWLAGELFLLHGFRSDVHPFFDDDRCHPRRSDLPPGATHGVECEPRDARIERVGAFLFPDNTAARAAYENRLAEYGLGFEDDGGCPFTDATTGAPEWRPRSACFVNEFGRANLRLLWPGQSVVVGVLGRYGHTKQLAGWLRAGEPETVGDPSFEESPWTGGLGPPTRFEACAAGAQPEPIAAPMIFSYESSSGSGAIGLRDPSGADRLLQSGGIAAAWSPDGRHLAYLHVATEGRSEIRLFDPDSGEDRLLVTPAEFVSELQAEGMPVLLWSPDSQRLAFTTSTAGRWPKPSVWLTEVPNGAPTRLADGFALDWSADGTRLLVGLSETYDPMSQTSVRVAMHDLGSGEQSIIGRGSSARWSADCRFVSLSTLDARTRGVVVLDGVNTRPRLALQGWPGEWSPASNDMLFGTGGETWIANADRGTAARIVAASGAAWSADAAAAWSPDGARIAITSPGTGLLIANADGSDPRVVAGPAYPTRSLAWSPDGRFILSFHYFTGETCGGPEYGFLIATDGSGVDMLPHSGPMAWRPVAPHNAAAAAENDPPPDSPEGCGD